MNTELSRQFDLPQLAASGKTETLSASKEELVEITERADIPRVKLLEGEVSCSAPGPGIFELKGRLKAKVVQVCSRSGEKFEDLVEDEFVTRFVSSAVLEKMTEEDIEALDDYEILETDVVEVGEILLQYFLLALDPYPALRDEIPQKPSTSGVNIISEDQATEKNNPFAKLKKLQKKT